MLTAAQAKFMILLGRRVRKKKSVFNDQWCKDYLMYPFGNAMQCII